MKTFFGTLLLLFCLLSAGKAQTSAVRAGGTVIVNTDDEGTYLGGGLGFETAIGKRFSINGGFDIAKGEISETFFIEGLPLQGLLKVQVINLQPEIRYYFSEALTGVFVGLQADVNFSKYEGSPHEPIQNYSYVGPGITLGAVLKMNDSMDFSFKIGASKFIDEGVGISGKVRIGYRF